MQRQLKFRVWDKLEKRFIYPDKGYQGHYVLDLNGRFQNLQNGSGGDEYVVQQYIGLKDADGRDIYEGDLVQYNQNSSYDNISFEVVWSFDERKWVLISKNNDELVNEKTPNGYRYRFLKIVGNIFETQERFEKLKEYAEQKNWKVIIGEPSLNSYELSIWTPNDEKLFHRRIFSKNPEELPIIARIVIENLKKENEMLWSMLAKVNLVLDV